MRRAEKLRRAGKYTCYFLSTPPEEISSGDVSLPPCLRGGVDPQKSLSGELLGIAWFLGPSLQTSLETP